MKETNSNRFRCHECGKVFWLNADDFRAYLNGEFIEVPNTCDECLHDSTAADLISQF